MLDNWIPIQTRQAKLTSPREVLILFEKLDHIKLQVLMAYTIKSSGKNIYRGNLYLQCCHQILIFLKLSIQHPLVTLFFSNSNLFQKSENFKKEPKTDLYFRWNDNLSHHNKQNGVQNYEGVET